MVYGEFDQVIDTFTRIRSVFAKGKYFPGKYFHSILSTAVSTLVPMILFADDSSPVSRLDLVLGFIRTGIEPIFGIFMILALKVLDLSLKSHINDPVFESFFWNTAQLNFTR